MSEIEQVFTALTPREKMKFLRWATESVGARLDTVFGSPETGRMSSDGEMEIPECLKR